MGIAAAVIRRFTRRTEGRPASTPTGPFALQRNLDQELAELERKGLARQVNGSFVVTAKGLEYLQRKGGR